MTCMRSTKVIACLLALSLLTGCPIDCDSTIIWIDVDLGGGITTSLAAPGPEKCDQFLWELIKMFIARLWWAGDSAYVPPQALARPGQLGQTQAFFNLRFPLDGSPASGSAQDLDFRSFDAAHEPFASAFARYARDDSAGPPTRRIFYADSEGDQVIVYDPATERVEARISVGTSPHGLAFSPYGDILYAANFGSASISIVDVATLTAAGSIPVRGAASLRGLAISPDGSRLYAVGGDDAGSLYVVDPAAGEVLDAIRIGRQPTRVRLSPDGARAYVALSGAGSVVEIDTLTLTAVAAFSLPEASDIAVSPTGATVFALSGGNVGRVVALSASAFGMVDEWTVGEEPRSMSLTEDGRFLLIANSESTFLNVIDLLTRENTSVPAPEGLGPSVAVYAAE